MSYSYEQKQLLDDLKSVWESEFKPLNDRLTAEAKARGQATAESKQSLDRVDSRMDAIEVAFQKLAFGSRAARHVDSQEMKAYIELLRKGPNRVSEETKASLSELDDSQGGFLAPPDYMREILKGIVEFSPIREIVRVVSTSAQSVKWPKRTGTFTGQWIAEQGGKLETTGLGYGLEEIPTHELYALVDSSNWLLEDAEFDLETELTAEFSEQFGVAEGAALVNGNGVGKPEGFLSNAALVAGARTSSTNDALVADDLIDLYYDPKTEYARNGTWVMSRDTIKRVRKLKDAQNQYLWQPGLAGLAPATILDAPYVEAKDVPNVADQALAVAFGDFRRGYIVVDRIEMAVQRDPFTQATAGATRFIARRRVGGQVVVPEAIKLLKIQ